MQISTGGRIFLGIALIQLVSAALILGGFLYSIQADLDRLTEQNAEEAVLRSIETTEAYFGPAERLVLASQQLLSGDVIGRNRPAQLERYFFEQLRPRGPIAGLFAGYPDGGFFYVMRSDRASVEGTRTKVIAPRPDGREVALTWRDLEYQTVKAESDPNDSYDPRTRDWYRLAAERRDVVWSDPYIFFTSRKPGITAAIAVRDEGGEVGSVAGVDLELSEVSSFLRQVALSSGGSAYIVAPGGEVIAHGGADAILPGGGAEEDSLRFRKITEQPGFEGAAGQRILDRLSEQSGIGASTVWKAAVDGRESFVAVGKMSSVQWPWLVVVVVPEKGLAELGRVGTLILFGIVLMVTALACAVGYAFSQGIGRPLAVLHRNARLAPHGNVEVMEEVASGYKEIDETDDILRSLAEERRGKAPTKDV